MTLVYWILSDYFNIADLKSRHLIGLSVNQHNMRRFQLSDEVTCLLVVGVSREGNVLDLIIAVRISGYSGCAIV